MARVTLAQPVQLEGLGLHTGQRAWIVLEPASPRTGIVFLRADLPHAQPIPARVAFVHETRLCTSLSDGTHSLRSIEHLMAALALCEVDDVLIRLFGEELPQLDGSARPFVQAIEDAGRKLQPGVRLAWQIPEVLEVRDGHAFARLSPLDTPSDRNRPTRGQPPLESLLSSARLTCTIRFAHPLLEYQQLSIRRSDAKQLLAPARTFCLESQLRALRDAGLIQGGSLQSALVLGEAGWINPEGLRFPDEPVRHKLLDALGDLALAGAPILGNLDAYCAGHSLHLALVAALETRREDPGWRVALSS